MQFFALVTISERFMEIVNPTIPEKLLTVGRFLRLLEGSRVIDFGCGYGEALVLWAEHFGITGLGIDVREAACVRAEKKMAERGFADRIEIICGKGQEYSFEEHSFDAAACIGASFIWGGYRPTLAAMKRTIRAEGRLVIGEPYWLSDNVDSEYAEDQKDVHTEHELLEMTRAEGFDVEYVVRASHDDWDRYEADNWHGLIRWLEENPDHPERQDVIDHFHKYQDEYFRYGRQYMGWAMYILAPKPY